MPIKDECVWFGVLCGGDFDFFAGGGFLFHSFRLLLMHGDWLFITENLLYFVHTDVIGFIWMASLVHLVAEEVLLSTLNIVILDLRISRPIQFLFTLHELV